MKALNYISLVFSADADPLDVAEIQAFLDGFGIKTLGKLTPIASLMQVPVEDWPALGRLFNAQIILYEGFTNVPSWMERPVIVYPANNAKMRAWSEKIGEHTTVAYTDPVHAATSIITAWLDYGRKA